MHEGCTLFEVWSQFVFAGQSNYRAAWSDSLARSEQSVCSGLSLLPLLGCPCCRGHTLNTGHIFMSHPELVLKATQAHHFGWLQHYMHRAEVNFLDFLDINGVRWKNCPWTWLPQLPLSSFWLQNTQKQWKSSPASVFLYATILLVFCCCISSFSFTKRAKRVIDVFIVLLASCQWSILLSCCEMKLLHAQLSPSSQAHHDKTLTKTCQLWVCGKAFRSESGCMFKVKTPDIRNSQTASLELIGWWRGNGSSYWWQAQLKCCRAHMPITGITCLFLHVVHRGKPWPGSEMKGAVSQHLQHSCPPAPHIAQWHTWLD